MRDAVMPEPGFPVDAPHGAGNALHPQVLHRLANSGCIIRHAVAADLPRLVELEALCWQHTRTPAERIQARLVGHPAGQLVLEKAGRVLGVVYSQRIAAVEGLAGRNAGNVHELHDPAGRVVQLLAVNVDPQVQDQQLGDQLLEFMLQQCSLAEGIDRVVGVTLCKSYDARGPLPLQDYIRLQGSGQDPVLAFHQDHGAQILQLLPGYRPQDLANGGQGVLVSYDLRNRVPRRQQAALQGRPADRAEWLGRIQAEVMALRPEAGHVADPDRPLMELGLDSADLMQLQRRIEALQGRALPAAFFFQFNTIDKVAAYLAPGATVQAQACAAQAAHRPAADIAVVGMACKLPGGIECPDDLWQALAAGRSLVGTYPRERGDWPSGLDQPGIDQGGFVHDAAAFDSSFFRIAPKEAQVIDPQQRMLLELAWACVEDAGILPADLKGTRTGVFVGASNTDYSRLIQAAQLPAEAHHATGNALAVLANRISYFLDLCGPSLSIDTACSASLVALHGAVQSLRTGECTAALVGGVNLICHPALSVAYQKAGMLASDGLCKVFDARANGYVRSEGAVVVLLKPLAAALAEGNRIHAVIRGSAVNHGGLAAGLTVPNPQKQSELLQAAWQNAGIAPQDLCYLEAHGTGTSLGDPIEVQGIGQALGAAGRRPAATPCFLGSVKSNLGHLEAAAGLAGLLKVILSLQHRQLPATIHFERLNPKICLEGTPLQVVQSLRAWDTQGPRIAGVSSFGSGGANAHVVVQEYLPPTPPSRSCDSGEAHLFVLSAAAPDRLRDHARRVLHWLDGTQDGIAEAIRIWQTGRTAMKQRLAFTVADRAELQHKLRRWLDGERVPRVWTSDGTEPAAHGEAAIEAAVAARDLERLAALWVSGAAIDWRQLHVAVVTPPAVPPIPLPTYPFARDRYWVAPAAGAAEPAEASQTLFFEETWQEQAAAAPAAQDGTQVLILADDEFHARLARNDTQGRFAAAVRVCAATGSRQVSARSFEVRIDDAAGLRHVLETAMAGSDAPVAIVCAWARGRDAAGVHALFELFRCIQSLPPRVTQVTLVGEYDPARADTCWDHAWIGFERSLRLGLPQTRVSLLYASGPDCSAEALWDALHSAGAIWHQGAARRVLAVQPVTQTRTQEAPVLRPQGGYLITGGCGALGHRVATELARHCAARLVLIGRSPLTPAIQAQLDALYRAGATQAVYAALDLSDRDAVLGWARTRPFPLCGVVHAAGVFTAEPLATRSAAAIDSVLGPKTVGTLALDEALADEALDFVCHFSSSSALLGDFGSCDYAIANRFQMAAARHRMQVRRPGRTVLINWPLWKDGGMAPGDAARTAFYLKTSGQEALETDAGLAIWLDLLAAQRTQTLVLVGRPQRLLAALQRTAAAGPAPLPALPQPKGAAGQPGRPLKDAVLHDLRQLVSACTGVAVAKLQDDANLAEYGFDSIHLTDLALRMTRHFGVAVTPVVFFSHATLVQLAHHLMATHAAHLQDRYGAPLPQDRPAGVAAPAVAAAGGTAAEPVAIVGMSGRFPQARSIDELWTLLAQGRSAITEIPADRWDWRPYFSAPGDPRNRITTNQGGFIDGVGEFDPLFFGISPREAEDMDPAERLLLMEAYKALEDAGLAPQSFAGRRVGVFVGMEEGQYDAIIGRQGITTSGAAMVSSRLSYVLDLHGPAVATNTACSSGLVALHQAVMSLRQGECESAIAASVALNLSPSGYLMMSEAGMLSREGQCFSFAQDAAGIGVGEAVVALVLKPLSAALAAGDTIHGIIRASGINFDGKTQGVTAPSGRMQAELFEQVYAAGGIDVGDIGHVVAHGTGTPLGDPVEIQALDTAFKRRAGGRASARHCAVTSCKSNLGHTLASSGLVSVVSLLLGLRHRQIPPTLNCAVESDYFNWVDSPFYINRTLRDWGASGRPRLGAVSAFGRSGTNAHVVIEEPPASAAAAMPCDGDVIVPLSARTAEQLRQVVLDLLDFIRKDPDGVTGGGIDLASLAGSLQLGRDAMAQRLGFIVGSVQQLAGRLQAWLDDGPASHGAGVQCGTAKGEGHTRDGSSDGHAELEAWIRQRNLAEILRAWVNGADIDWRYLHAGALPRRLRLPTYPFARDHYWASGAAVPGAARAGRETAQLHPLLHENTSDLETQRYTSHFTGEEFFFDAHRVFGQRVLPGVAYLEMARAAVERAVPQAPGGTVLELRHTAWLQPCTADSGASLAVSLCDETPGELSASQIAYEIHGTGGDSGTLHCQGQAVFCARPAVAPLDIAALQAQMVDGDIDPARLYAAYRTLGLDYGPAFQGIRTVRRGAGQLLAHLVLPVCVARDAAAYGLPPSLLDGALQSALALQAGFDASPGQPPLPFELATLRVLGPCAPEMLAWVRRAPGGPANAPLDIDLCGLDGTVCVQMRGFCSRSPAAAHGPAAEGDAAVPQVTTVAPAPAAIAPGLHSFVPVWTAVDTLPDAAAPAASAGVLLVGDDPAQQAFVRRWLPQARSVALPAGAGIDAIGAALRSTPFEHLLWIAPDVMAGSPAPQDPQHLIADQETGVLAVFRLAKALVAAHAATPLEWTLVTRRTQRVRPGDPVAPAHAAVAGLVGSLAKEYPHWKLRLVDIDDAASFPLAQALSLACDPQGDGHAWRAGEWFRQELAQVTAWPQVAPAYRQNGVYVVIGGAGGLGEVWSRHVAEQVQARIVWIGRRSPDVALQARLDALAELGAAPLYVPADATDLAALERARDQVLRTHGRIDGVVHSALVLRDQTVMAMDEARFKEALRAKVDISVNLAQVFGGLDLDFMVFFSSMMSFLKAAGQGNYAAGCTFKDSFAGSLQGRSRYPVKTMNWGYWGAVGVVSDAFYRRRMAQAGIGSIEPEEGMEALQWLLGGPQSQVVCFRSLDAGLLGQLRVTATLRHLPAAAGADLQQVQEQFARHAGPDVRARLEAGRIPDEVNALAARILAATLQSLHLLDDQAAKPDGLLPCHQRWLEASRRYLRSQPGAGPGELPPLQVLWRDWDALQSRRAAPGQAHPDAQWELLDTCLRALPDVLAGRRLATDVMFPESSLRLVQGVYAGHPTADAYNDLLGQALRAHVEAWRQRAGQDARLRILEIGAGTGGTTARLLPILREFAGAIGEYCYTDLSRAFLLHGQQQYQPHCPALTTAVFDVSKPLAAQAVAAGHYDVVIATNVLHATPDIRASLRNAKALLRSQGVLLLNELSTWTLYNHLTFGLLEGWWLPRDEALRLPGSPVLSPAAWTQVLGEAGFAPVIHADAPVHAFGQQVIAALSDGVVRQALPGVLPVVTATPVPAAPAAAGPTVPLRQAAIAYFQRLVAGALKMRADQLDPCEPLERYGLDSILVVQLANQVRAVLPDITSTLFFEVRTVQGLVDHLLQTRAGAVAALVAVPASPGLAPAAPAAAQAPAGLRPHRRQARAATPATTSRRAPFDVAVIGCSARYPKSPDLETFWDNLAGGRSCISEIPPGRWDWRAYHHDEKGRAGCIYTRWGGFLEDIDTFDPLFFRISPREAKGMDPQERLFLQACYHAIEDAGHTPQTLGDVRKVGVYVGIMNSRYNPQPLYYSVANRVSYLFDFQGPSMAVDTACSSSLTAIHLALESLYSGTCECAIAGGVNLIIDPVHYQQLSALTMLSSGSECRSFGAGADGFVDAEGVGAVVLKPLEHALRDGDTIQAVIKGSAVNAGGRTHGYTVPNPRAQSQVVLDALERAGVDAADVSYVEAHGTGTALGDPIEIAGLTRAFRASTQDRGFCAVGSLKSNIGHCESAAGIAALTKVLLQLRHGCLVPSLHGDPPNPEIDFGSTPFRIQTALQAWQRPRRVVDGVAREIARTAGISSFGAGGANAHLIVQEHVPAARAAVAPAMEGPALVLLSARTAEQLLQKARDLLGFIQAPRQAPQALDLASLAYTLQVGREPMEERLALLVSSLDELQRRLQSHLAGEPAVPGVHQGQVRRHKEMVAWFAADADLQQTVQKWLAERKLAPLADLWAKGLNVDWRPLHGASRPPRISLPKYPFAKERYWREVPEAAPVAAAPGALHPLLHENVSTLHQQAYRSVFEGSDPRLAGLRLVAPGGDVTRSVVPAAVWLEMAHAAAGMAAAPTQPGEDAAIELRDVAWADPVPVQGRRQVALALFARGEDELAYEIYSPADEDTVHCQGRALLRQPAPPVRLDLAVLRLRMGRGRVDAASHYARLAGQGVQVATGYQGLLGIHLGDRELLAEMDLRAVAAADADPVAGAVALDCALQAAAALLPAATPASLPLAAASVRLRAGVAAARFAWVRESGAVPGAVQVDIDLCDGQGQVCVEVRGVVYEREDLPVAAARPGQVALAEPAAPARGAGAVAKPRGVALV